jgi:hypothetical protein
LIYKSAEDIAFVELNMAGYDSPIGKKQYQGQPFKQVTIPDESAPPPQQMRPQDQPAPRFDPEVLREFQSRMNMMPPEVPSMTESQAQMEQQFREAREAKITGRERLNDGAKRRIEILLGMTRHTRTFLIGANSFTLQTLRSRELREAVMAATLFDGSVQSPFEIRKQLLARSLIQIAGADADQFFGSSDMEVKLSAIDEFDHYLLTKLYDEYLAMVKEAQQKYSASTNEQAQEVVEDLKK